MPAGSSASSRNRSWMGVSSSTTASAVSAVAVEGGYVYFASATTGEVLRADRVTAEVDQDWRFEVRRSGGQPGLIVASPSAASVARTGDEDIERYAAATSGAGW